MKYIHAKKFEPKEYAETTVTTIDEYEILAKAAGQNMLILLSTECTCISLGVLSDSLGASNNIYVNSENLKRYSYKPT